MVAFQVQILQTRQVSEGLGDAPCTKLNEKSGGQWPTDHLIFLAGTIPESLAKLGKLKVLSLSSNQLSGHFFILFCWSVPTDQLTTWFSLIFCFLVRQRHHLSLTRVSANPFALFLFIPRRCTSSKCFPEETPAQVPHQHLRFVKSAVKMQMCVFLGWKAVQLTEFMDQKSNSFRPLFLWSHVARA